MTLTNISELLGLTNGIVSIPQFHLFISITLGGKVRISDQVIYDRFLSDWTGFPYWFNKYNFNGAICVNKN